MIKKIIFFSLFVLFGKSISPMDDGYLSEDEECARELTGRRRESRRKKRDSRLEKKDSNKVHGIIPHDWKVAFYGLQRSLTHRKINKKDVKRFVYEAFLLAKAIFDHDGPLNPEIISPYVKNTQFGGSYRSDSKILREIKALSRAEGKREELKKKIIIFVSELIKYDIFSKRKKKIKNICDVTFDIRHSSNSVELFNVFSDQEVDQEFASSDLQERRRIVADFELCLADIEAKDLCSDDSSLLAKMGILERDRNDMRLFLQSLSEKIDYFPVFMWDCLVGCFEEMYNEWMADYAIFCQKSTQFYDRENLKLEVLIGDFDQFRM